MTDLTLSPSDVAAVARRAAESENPDWYLTLLGLSVEHAPDFPTALRAADLALAETPHPPTDDDEDDLAAVSRAVALDGHPGLDVS